MQKKILQHVFLPIFGVLALLLFVQRIWNAVFLQHIRTSDYSGDIFRTTMQNTYAPMYQFQDYDALNVWTVACSLAVCIILLVLYKVITQNIAQGRNVLADKRSIYGVAALQIILTALFGLMHGTDRWLVLTHHYEGFTFGLPFCGGSFAQMLHEYSNIMAAPNMGAHLNHYPPGNLTLLLLSQTLGRLWFAKIIVLAASVATLWQMRRIATYLSIGNDITTLILLLYATNTGILIFPSLDFAALLPFFATWIVAAFLRLMPANSVANKVELGIAVSAFTFFSFNIAVVLCFILCWFLVEILSLLWIKNADLSGNPSIFIQKTPLLLSNIFVFILIYFIIYKTTDFDIIQCFRTGIANNSKLMNYDAFDSFTRYLLRSTGNLLAYCIGSLGIIPTILFVLSIKKTTNSAPYPAQNWLFTCVLFCLFAAFSTLFVGETERVWLYFTPFILLALAPLLTAWQSVFGWRLVLVLLGANAIITLCIEIFFHHIC